MFLPDIVFVINLLRMCQLHTSYPSTGVRTFIFKDCKFKLPLPSLAFFQWPIINRICSKLLHMYNTELYHNLDQQKWNERFTSMDRGSIEIDKWGNIVTTYRGRCARDFNPEATSLVRSLRSRFGKRFQSILV